MAKTKAKATKLKFVQKRAKGTKNIKEKSKRGGGFGNMVWIGADSEKVLRIIAEPKDWIEYNFVMVEETDDGKKLGFRGKLPCYAGFEDDVPEASRLNPRVGFIIPVVVIDEGKPGKNVMFYEPPKKVLNDLLQWFERRKTLTDRDIEVIREGSGRDTTYTLMTDDPKKRPDVVKMAKAWLEDDDPSFTDELMRMVKEFLGLYNADPEEEDDEPKKGKKSKSAGKSKASKRRAMADDDDEEEESDDDSEDDDDEGDDDDEEGDDDVDYSELSHDELKALCDERGIKTKKGQKSKTLIGLLEDHDANGDDDDEEEDDEEPDDDDGDDDDGDESVEGTFTVTDVDANAYTVDLTDGDEEYQNVYLDRSRDDPDTITEGAKYTLKITKDDDGDWIAVTPLKAAKSKKAKGGKNKK